MLVPGSPKRVRVGQWTAILDDGMRQKTPPTSPPSVSDEGPAGTQHPPSSQASWVRDTHGDGWGSSVERGWGAFWTALWKAVKSNAVPNT